MLQRIGSVEPGAFFERLAPAIATAIVFGVGVWAFRAYPVGIYMDDGVYTILAKAIATGHGLRNLHLPGMPLATHFPPGFPLLLAALWRIEPDFPANIQLFLLLQAVLFGLTALGTYAFARRLLEWRAVTALIAALAATLSLPLMSLGSKVFSELLALAILLPLLIWSELLITRGGSLLEAALLGACAGALGLVRTQVALIVPAVCLVFVLRRQWRTTLVFAAGALCLLLPWQLWSAGHDADVQGLLRGYYGSYGAWLATGVRTQGLHLVLATIRINAVAIAGTIANRVAPWPIGEWRLVPVLLAGAALVFGSVRLWKRAPVTVLFVVAYVALVVVWPFFPQRFIWGLWPVLLLVGAFGAAEAVLVMRRARNPAIQFLPMLASAGLVLGAAQTEVSAFRARAWVDLGGLFGRATVKQRIALLTPLVQWVNGNTQPGDLLVADYEPMVYLFTGRQTMPAVPFTAAEYIAPRTRREEADALNDLLRRYHARYVATVNPRMRDTELAMAQGAPSRLHALQALPNGAAFAVEPR